MHNCIYIVTRSPSKGIWWMALHVTGTVAPAGGIFEGMSAETMGEANPPIIRLES